MSIPHIFECILLSPLSLVLSVSYQEDMGSLRQRTIKNLGLRTEPILEVRMKEYSEFLHMGGIIENGEIIIAGVRGGGLAIIYGLPEILDKKCTRMAVSYKIGDVIVMVHLLMKVPVDTPSIQMQVGTVDYVRNNAGRMLHRTMLLSNIVLPPIVAGKTRNDLVPVSILGIDQRYNGMDIYRLQLNDMEIIRERENEIFNSTD
jgi:hypothetical protein